MPLLPAAVMSNASSPYGREAEESTRDKIMTAWRCLRQRKSIDSVTTSVCLCGIMIFPVYSRAHGMVVAVVVVGVSWSLGREIFVFGFIANHRVHPASLTQGISAGRMLCLAWFFAVRLISRRLDALSSVTGTVKFMR